MNKLNNYTLLAGRILIATMFVISGFSKIFEYEGTAGWMQSMGVPGMLLPLVIALEVLAGLAIILGWQTRIAALGLAGFSILTALIFHSNLADQMQYFLFMKNLALAGGFLLLVANGPGTIALDARKKGLSQ